ncbi:MAG: protein-glutamate O-methyltransferase CheR [Bacteroidota bacterium]
MAEIKVTKEEVLKVANELKANYKVDFTNYAESSLTRRIEYILTTYNLANVDVLISKIKGDNCMYEKLVNDITVNTTEMFRDPEVWLSIKRNIIPKLRSKMNINVWHAGCSSGEEVYSMAILLNEAGLLDRAKVLASDLNTTILSKAKAGAYNTRMHNTYFSNFDKVVKVNPMNEDEEINVPYDKYFDFSFDKSTFTVNSKIREKIVFRQFNLMDNIYLKFDIIFCRNVIIYFDNELQNKVITMFNNSLFDDGYLILGSHESMAYLPINSKFTTKFARGTYLKKI